VKSAKLRQVLERSLLAQFPQDYLEEKILPYVQHRELPANTIVRDGSEIDALYIVVKGQVGLFNGAAHIGTVREGRAIELSTFLKSAPHWQYSWKTLSEAHLISVPKKTLVAAFKKHMDLEQYLHRMVDNRALQRLKRDLALIGFNPLQVRATVLALEPLRMESLGESKHKRLVAVESGAVEVHGTGGYVRLRRGEIAVLDAGPVFAVNVLQDGEIWSLTIENWTAVVPEELVREACATLATDPIAEPESSLSDEESEDLDEALNASDEESEVLSDDELSTFFDGFTPSRPARGGFPFVAQHDRMDCGAACMSMIIRFHGKAISVARLRDALNVSTAGTSITDIEKCAADFGLKTMTIQSEIEGYADIPAPWIALMNHHFVVVYGVDDDKVKVADPESGLLEIEIGEFAEEFTGIGVLLRPAERFTKLPEDKFELFKFFVLLKGHYVDLARIVAVSAFLFACGLVSPLMMQILFDKILPRGQQELLGLFFGAFIAVACVKIVSEWVHEYLLVHLSTRFDAKLNALFNRHLFSLPLSYFALHRTGDFLSRLDELYKIRDFLLGKPVKVLCDMLSLCVYAVALAFYHPLLLLVMAAGIPLTAVLAYLSHAKLKQLLDYRFKTETRAESKYIESLTHLNTVRILNGAICARWKWERDYERSLESDRKVQLYGAKIDWSTRLVEHAVEMIFFMTTAYMFTRGQLTLGQAVAAATIGGQMIRPVMELLSEWKTFSEVSLSFEKVDEVFSSRSERRLNGGISAKIRGEIELRGVSFRYGGESAPNVLKDISLSIRPGESVALVGSSGSGKSTLVNMLNLLHLPSSGEIRIDGEPADIYDLESLRRQTSTILQDQTLFRGSIIENIALGDPQPSLQKAIAAARIADAHDFIMQLESGYFHQLESADELSGGEKQRIAIARAFYHRPKILVMDEATSALDGISERKVMRAIDKLRGKMTIVTVAHRLNSVVHADRIYVIERGQIVEEGDHRSLLKKRGHYYKLFRKQLSA
jgi:ATP-binding cassette, subfamily B, bacterial HlyB/CyaB